MLLCIIWTDYRDLYVCVCVRVCVHEHKYYVVWLCTCKGVYMCLCNHGTVNDGDRGLQRSLCVSVCVCECFVKCV